MIRALLSSGFLRIFPLVRDLLQNRVYTGRVPYAETLYNGSLGEGKRSSRNRKHWFEGKHEGLITEDLLDNCQKARKKLTEQRRPPTRVRTYILQGKVYCARCVASRPEDLVDPNYGKMRPGWHNRDGMASYRCLARDRGYCRCEQGYTAVDTLDEMVAHELASLAIPDGFRNRVEMAVKSRVENEEALRRMEEVQSIVERIDFKWEKGFMTPEEYIEKRTQLQKEIEALRPVDHDNLMEAADLIENFATYWDQCKTTESPEDARQQLIGKIVDRLFVYDDNVIAIALHGDFGLVLDSATSVPSDVLECVSEEIKKGTKSSNDACTQSGSDGHGSPTGCKLWVPQDGIYHLLIQHIIYSWFSEAVG